MIGQLCVKIAGKESGRYCVIVDDVDSTYVTIDGNLKRRKCNINHLELLNKKLDVKKGASTVEVHKAMEKAGIKVTKPKERKEIKKKQEKARNSKKKPEKVKKNVSKK